MENILGLSFYFSLKSSIMQTRVLVTAANGNTGYPAAKELLRLGHSVRAFVRNPQAAKAKDLLASGAELFVGDIQDIRDVRRALARIDSAYFVPSYPNVLLQGTTFAIAARELELAHVVCLSQWLSSPEHPSIYTQAHWRVDEMIKNLPVTQWTILNPGLFGFTYFMTPHILAQFGLFPDFGKNAPPSSEDIGLVAAHILKAPIPHRHMTYRITGKEVLDAKAMAQIIGEELGRKVSISPLPEWLMFKVFRAYGYPQIDASQVKYYVQEGALETWIHQAPSSTVRDIVGKEADDFRTLVRRYLLSHSIAMQSWSNWWKALLFMGKVMLTPSWNMDRFEQAQHFPKFKNMKLSGTSSTWQRIHHPQFSSPS